MSDQHVYVDEYGRELDEEEVKELLEDIHKAEYPDWGWIEEDENEPD